MALTTRKLTYAPVPSSNDDESIQKIAMMLLGANSDAAKAIACAAEKCVDTSISLERFSEGFINAISLSYAEHRYKHVIGPLVEVDDTNCAILANERISEWLSTRSRKESTARFELDRTLQLIKFVKEEHERSSSKLSAQKRRAVSAWSEAVRKWLCAERVKALRAIKSFTKTALCKTLRSFGDMQPQECDKEFLLALFRHKACGKHSTPESRQPYASSGRGRKIAPFVSWCNFLSYTIPTCLVDGDELMERFLLLFNRGWRNNHLSFAADWQGKVFQGNTLRMQYTDRTGRDPWDTHQFDVHREAYIIETAVLVGNVRVLEALATNIAVNNESFLDVLGMRMAVNITNRTANSSEHFFHDALPLRDLSHDMLKYLFSPRPGKPALKLPSMLLDPPEVTAVGMEPISEIQRTLWITTAKEERRIWFAAHSHGWKMVRNAHKLSRIGNWWSETALRHRYHAAEDEDGRPLMVGAAARQDQTAWGSGGGVEALDAATGSSAANAVVDLKEAAHDAAMERDLIAAREESRAADAAAKAAADKATAAKAALRDMGKKRKFAKVCN